MGGAAQTHDDVVRELPLLGRTRRAWGVLAANQLGIFLADHAVCEQQAALTALHLVAHYPDDEELVGRMSDLAAEEVLHLRRVLRLLHARGLRPARRRPNPYVQGLHSRIKCRRGPELKLDRLLVGALIEARSCERFTCLLEALGQNEPEVTRLLCDLGPAEKRHWEIFFSLAAREAPRAELEGRWRGWLEWECELMSGLGQSPTVHG